MKTSEAIAHFHGNVSELARAVGVDQSTIYSWREYPPDRRQLQIQRLTDRALMAEPECEARVLGLPLQRKTDRKPAKGRKTARA